MWQIEGTDEFAAWYEGLSEAQSESVDTAIQALELGGPALGRPFVDTLKGSRHSHMKELRPRPGNLRIIFAFDPRQSAILLLGGDKTGQWNEWYRKTIPTADALYDAYLEELEREGLI